MGIKPSKRNLVLLCAAIFLSGCEEGALLITDGPDTSGRGEMVEREVEAPDVFESKAEALWDGRPSLGGVWVAYPGVKDPERVLITNTANNKTIVGALFRKERETPGPAFQISSDAAEGLAVVAGKPVTIKVVALRMEEVPVSGATPLAAELTDALPADGAIQATSLDPVETAAAAIAKSEALAPSAQTKTAAAKPAPKPPSNLPKPYVQIGNFSVKNNAYETARALTAAGMTPIVKQQSSQGKRFWRVIVGPAQTRSERAAIMKKATDAGFKDAYTVAN